MYPKNEIKPLSVGIMQASHIEFCLNGPFLYRGENAEGCQDAGLQDGKILWKGHLYDCLYFDPTSEACTFSLSHVTIGKEFHWQRQERQTFQGALQLKVHQGEIIAINKIDIEKYLESVISSEMSATAHLEFLKAAAIISRSWLFCQIQNRETRDHGEPSKRTDKKDTPGRLITWTGSESHQLFDVCADDHCQRYQGITKIVNENARKAVSDTCGQVLVSDEDGAVCDARFSKCCGGISEEYATCWDNKDVPYLQPVSDTIPAHELPQLQDDTEVSQWILSQPTAFCNTNDKKILQQVLNDYDQETMDFYRWHVTYTQEELSSLLFKKTNIHFGNIIDLIPIQRGASGRIYELLIKGSLRQRIIGKELTIRRALSEKHLYSSAFIVEKGDVQNGIPQQFTLHGAGWGHGVGLCQIGAAVMASKGYSYTDILYHYYKHTHIKNIY